MNALAVPVKGLNVNYLLDRGVKFHGSGLTDNGKFYLLYLPKGWYSEIDRNGKNIIIDDNNVLVFSCTYEDISYCTMNESLLKPCWQFW